MRESLFGRAGAVGGGLGPSDADVIGRSSGREFAGPEFTSQWDCPILCVGRCRRDARNIFANLSRQIAAQRAETRGTNLVLSY